MHKDERSRFSIFRKVASLLGFGAIGIMLFLSGCNSTGVLSKSTEYSILKGAKKVIVNSKLPADSLYHEFYEVFSNNGYIITHSSDAFHQVSAKGIQNNVIVNVIVNSTQDGSQAIVTGGYSYMGNSNRAEWKGIVYERRYAFAHLVKISMKVDGKIMYSK